MQSQPSQKEFDLMIMLVGITLCFKPNEDYLSEEQVVIRGFSPLEEYSKACIAKLIDSGVVEFKSIEPSFPYATTQSTLYIKRPVSEKQMENFIYETSEKIIKLLSLSNSYVAYLHSLVQEISACECLEYAQHYASREKLKIIDPSPSNGKLKLLVMESSVDKINALLWRAVKKISCKASYEQRTVKQEELIDIAFEIYIRYKKLNIKIEGYQAPSCLKPSILSGLLELYRGEII